MVTDCQAVNKVDTFLASPYYIALTAILTGIAHAFHLELLLYTLFTAMAIYVCLSGADFSCLTPLVIFSYLAPSAANNPGRYDTSIFSVSGPYILVLAGLIVLAFCCRLIRDRRTFFHKKRTMTGGIVILLCAYLLSGIGSSGYEALAGKNLLFAALQGLCILLPYWIFSGTVRPGLRKDYFAWVGFCTGGLLLWQILLIYCSAGVIINGVIDRNRIFSGWGMYNNIGGILAMMIPFAFYLASKYRKGWIGTVAGSSFLIGVILTCSRSAILCGSVIYIFCTILMLIYAHNRKANTIALLSVFGVVLVTVIVFHKPLLQLYSSLLQQGMDPSSRDVIYKNGLRVFWQNPVFGISFYPPDNMSWSWSTVESFSSFFPARWHNTLIQLLAGCGIVGLCAYAFHRIQTLRFFLRNRCKEVVFIGCSVLVLLLTSMLDCHLFNIGPAMFYAMALAFMENTATQA